MLHHRSYNNLPYFTFDFNGVLNGDHMIDYMGLPNIIFIMVKTWPHFWVIT